MRNSGRVTAVGATSLQHDPYRLLFEAPVDLEYTVVSRAGQAFAASAAKSHAEGFDVTPWTGAGNDDSRTLGKLRANFSAIDRSPGTGPDTGKDTGKEAEA